MTGKRYVLHPGTVISHTDGQSHYVDERRLADLYQVDRRECLIAGPGVRLEDAIHLYPRSDGDYRLPGAER